MQKKIEQLKNNGELTELQAKTMNWLLTEGYYAEKYFSDLTAEDIADAIEVPINQFRGVLASLIHRDYLIVIEDDGLNIVYARNKGYQLSDEYEDRWEPDNILY